MLLSSPASLRSSAAPPPPCGFLPFLQKLGRLPEDAGGALALGESSFLPGGPASDRGAAALFKPRHAQERAAGPKPAEPTERSNVEAARTERRKKNRRRRQASKKKSKECAEMERGGDAA